jgi:hypothetical protein
MKIMMIFNMSTWYFQQIFISLFWGLFNDQTDLRVKYAAGWYFLSHERAATFEFNLIQQNMQNMKGCTSKFNPKSLKAQKGQAKMSTP